MSTHELWPKAKGLLEEALKTASSREVGQAMGYKCGSFVRRVLTAPERGIPDSFVMRVINTFDVVACPHLEQQIAMAECKEYALRPCPTSNPKDSRHWRACQACPKKPNGEPQ